MFNKGRKPLPAIPALSIAAACFHADQTISIPTTLLVWGATVSGAINLHPTSLCSSRWTC